MPFASDDIRVDLVCRARYGEGLQGWVVISLRAGALRRLGLHPDQPTAS